jgi:hypothetical protein
MAAARAPGELRRNLAKAVVTRNWPIAILIIQPVVCLRAGS